MAAFKTKIQNPHLQHGFPREGGVDEHAFPDLFEAHRQELQSHCYRMLGSVHDAEDLVQETFVRAWRGLERFEGRSSLRSWLYRIATNAFLNLLSRRGGKRRILPESEGPPSDVGSDIKPANGINWLEPFPDSANDAIVDSAPNPSLRLEIREATHLAFIAAIQYLPPRQRAVLLLRDALDWSSNETAQALNMSIASVNSALQRARATLAKEFPAGLPRNRLRTQSEHERSLLERYVQAWESADLDAFVALLREDAVFSMPPYRQWYLGRNAIRSFFQWAWSGCHPPPFKLLGTGANHQPAFALYTRGPKTSEFRALSIQVLEVRSDGISKMTNFIDTALFDSFSLPLVLPAIRQDSFQ